jgi:PAS domain S-box-containing protein
MLPRLLTLLQLVSRATSPITILVGVLVLVGWTFDIPTLKSVIPGLATMKANTALAFVLAGSALWLARKNPLTQRARHCAQVCALLVVVVGGLTLLEYLVGIDLGIDQFLFTEPSAAGVTAPPGRMALTAAFNFLLLGVALLLLSTDRAYELLQLLTLTALGVVLLALVGYVYGASTLYHIGPYSSVAIHTAMTFAMLCLGILFACADRGLMQIITSANAGGVIARWLVPPAVLVPFLLGWLRLKGQQAGLYPTEFGIALFVLATIIIFTALVWWTARALDLIDRERQHTVDELTVEVHARERVEAALRQQADRVRVQAEALHASEARLAGIIASAMDAIISIDEAQRILLFNVAAEQMFRCPAAEAIGQLLDRFIPARFQGIHSEQIRAFGRTGITNRSMLSLGMLTALRADGEEFPIEASISQVVVAGQRVFTVIIRDITERKRLEAQLLQAQKMESIGQLAGGIAHDFNNVLSAVIGFLGTAQQQLSEDHLVQRDLQVAEASAWRAARLTRQLLTFARKQIVEPHVLNLNDVIVEMDKLLRQLIGEDIELVSLPADDLGQIKADPGQIEQVIANLVVNARDAMPHGGRLTIETANTWLDADYTRQHVGVVPGDYVMLAVSDTGTGMDDSVQKHIFEPFYTTKEIDKGTGLGLGRCAS